MPIYDYECKTCEVMYSTIAKISDIIEPPKCETCGLETTRRFNFGAVTFKGDGFYRTDKNKKEE